MPARRYRLQSLHWVYRGSECQKLFGHRPIRYKLDIAYNFSSWRVSASLNQPGLFSDCSHRSCWQILFRMWNRYRKLLVRVPEDVMATLDSYECPSICLKLLDQLPALHWLFLQWMTE